MKKALIAVVALALFVSCSNEDNLSTLSPTRVPLHLNAVSVMSLVHTKADFTSGNTLALVVKVGDGIYHSATPCVYQLGGDPISWSPINLQNTAYASGTSDKVVGYCPIDYTQHDANSDGIAQYGAELYNEALDYNAPNNSDFCTSDPVTVSVFNPNITLSLKHMNSVLDFRLKKAADFTPSPGAITNIQLSGANVSQSRDYNYNTHQWEGASQGSSTNSLEVNLTTFSINQPNFDNNTVTRIPLLVPPCDFDINAHYFLSFTIDSHTYKVELPTTMMTKIESNHSYIIEIEFNQQTIVTNKISVNEWNTTTTSDSALGVDYSQK